MAIVTLDETEVQRYHGRVVCRSCGVVLERHRGAGRVYFVHARPPDSGAEADIRAAGLGDVRVASAPPAVHHKETMDWEDDFMAGPETPADGSESPSSPRLTRSEEVHAWLEKFDPPPEGQMPTAPPMPEEESGGDDGTSSVASSSTSSSSSSASGGSGGPAGPGGIPIPPPLPPRPLPLPTEDFYLDGRRLTEDEVDDFVEWMGGEEGTGLLTTEKLQFAGERRIVSNRNVRSTNQDMVVQSVSFVKPSGSWLWWIVVPLVVVCWWLRVTTLAGARPGLNWLLRCVCYELLPGLEWTIRHGLDVLSVFPLLAGAYSRQPAGSFTRRKFLVCFVAALSSFFWATYPFWFRYVVVGCVMYCVAKAVRLRRKFVIMLTIPFAYLTPFLMVAVFLAEAAFEFGSQNRSWLRRCIEVKVVFPPHMVSCALVEYASGADADTVTTNTRGKLLRLATLPIPDAALVAFTSGAEKVVQFLASRESFFEAGAFYRTTPL